MFRPDRVLEDLYELDARTGGVSGARRVAWSDDWVSARELLEARLADLPVAVNVDEAGNLWAFLPGLRSETVVIGSHLDSVPNGGWLDGAFGVMAALEVLRDLATDEPPACSIALVDWADEEGARFGRSLFGSSAVSGSLDVEAARNLQDSDGNRLEDVLRYRGVHLDQILRARARLDGVAAYIEAHIEQGPVLESEGLPISAVLGTVGIERHRVVFQGEASHAGSTPMDRRRDPFLAAAKTSLAVREAAVHHGGVGTVGAATTSPGIVTAVAAETAVLLDQRHQDPEALASMLADVRVASEAAAEEEGCTVEWQPIWKIQPIPFDPTLTDVARNACRATCGHDRVLPSGALHDAAEMARHVPTAMIFASSCRGLSHNRAEDTPELHLKQATEALRLTVRHTVDMAAE